jgi:hypothetical protein
MFNIDKLLKMSQNVKILYSFYSPLNRLQSRVGAGAGAEAAVAA